MPYKGSGNLTSAEKKALDKNFRSGVKNYSASLGVNLPLGSDDFISYILRANYVSNKNDPKKVVDDYLRDKKGYLTRYLEDRIAYSISGYAGQSGVNVQNMMPKSIESAKQHVRDLQYHLNEAGFSNEEISTLVEKSFKQGIADYESGVAQIAAIHNDGNWLDAVAAPIMAVTGAIATGGLSLAQQIAFNAVGSALQGGDIETILRNSLATLAVNEIPGFLDTMKISVNDPAMQAVIDNVAKQATAAAIKGQDIKAAALGGLAGGAVAQGISTSGQLGSYNDQIARAAGEYVQGKTAGLSEEQALTRALTGFISQTEKEQAREKVLQKAESGTYTDPNKKTPQPGTSEYRAMEEKTLPTVEVTGERFKPTSADKLSITDKGKQSQVSERNKALDPRYRVLLSILDQPSLTSQFTGGTSGGQKSSVATTGQGASPGTSALAQALRTDTNETVIAGDKGGRRKGWNLESLRYMGNSGG
jgi:hypothetical protein